MWEPLPKQSYGPTPHAGISRVIQTGNSTGLIFTRLSNIRGGGLVFSFAVVARRSHSCHPKVAPSHGLCGR